MAKILGLQPTPHLKLLRFVCHAALNQRFVSKHELEERLQRLFGFGSAKARDYVGLALKLGLLRRDLSVSELGLNLLHINTLPADNLDLSLGEKEFYLKLLLERDDECILALLRLISQHPNIRIDQLQNVFSEAVGFCHLKAGARRVKTMIRTEWLASLELIKVHKNVYSISKRGQHLLQLFQTEKIEAIPRLLYKETLTHLRKAESVISSITPYTSLSSIIIPYFVSTMTNALKDKTGRTLERVLCDGYRILGFYVKPLGSERSGKEVPDSLTFVPENWRFTSCIVNDAKNIKRYNPSSKDMSKMLRYCKLAFDSTGLQICAVFLAPNFSAKALKKVKEISRPDYINNIALITTSGFLSLIQITWRKREEGVYLRPKAIYETLADAKVIIDEKYVQREIDTRAEFGLM
jgi:hypothetical protein